MQNRSIISLNEENKADRDERKNVVNVPDERLTVNKTIS